MERIAFTTDYQVLADADFLIENVTEKWTIKKQLYTRIDAICPDHTIFAANTSAILITRIASLTERAPKVVGIHFMNPVWSVPMVEVIRGQSTSDETVESTRRLLAKMRNDYAIVNDSPGFVSNRVLMLTINEAIHLVQEQVASAEDVDRIFRKCFSHKMGPLETADQIGLDTILFSIEVLSGSFQDSRFKLCELLRKMVDEGLYGRKSGRGFYTYDMHKTREAKGQDGRE